MKVWHYHHDGDYFWVAESDSGYRTTGFKGLAPGDPWAARAALAAAYLIDAELTTKPHGQARAALKGLKDLRPKMLRPRRDTSPAVLLLSRPGDGFCACVMAWDQHTWVGDVAFGADETKAADEAVAAFLRQTPSVEAIEFAVWTLPAS